MLCRARPRVPRRPAPPPQRSRAARRAPQGRAGLRGAAARAAEAQGRRDPGRAGGSPAPRRVAATYGAARLEARPHSLRWGRRDGA